MHTSVSGVADHLANSDGHAIRLAREAIQDLGKKQKVPVSCQHLGRLQQADALGQANSPAVPVKAPMYPSAELDTIVPLDPRQSFDMREVIARITDGSEFREFKSEYGKTIITVRALDTASCSLSPGLRRDSWAHVSSSSRRAWRAHPFSVGIIANNGVLLSPSALKATHFMELCSQRQIPLVFLVNVSGYMVGEKAERGGIAKDGAKMVRAVARAKVPKFTIIVGGSFG